MSGSNVLVRGARAGATVQVAGRSQPAPTRAAFQPCSSTARAWAVRVPRLLWSAVTGSPRGPGTARLGVYQRNSKVIALPAGSVLSSGEDRPLAAAAGSPRGPGHKSYISDYNYRYIARV